MNGKRNSVSQKTPIYTAKIIVSRCDEASVIVFFSGLTIYNVSRRRCTMSNAVC